MSSSNGMEVSEIEEKQPKPELKAVISDLRRGSDIEGAILVDEKDAIIATALPENKNYERDIPEILEILEKGYGSNLNKHDNFMFAQQIFDFNGFKVLAKKLRDKLTLLVLLKKQGYISLAMLDIENSVRKIDEIM
jgi:predicted regulator of Ras-like GTPase activity (Roadblock/LC7/MglB family)